MASSTKQPPGEYVKARVIAEMFDVSVGAVSRGEASMDRIGSVYLPTGGKRPPRRYYLPDALALKRELDEQRLQRQHQREIPAGILRLTGKRRQRA
jgi:hypothetical protein